MKKLMIAAACLMAGTVSAELLVSWDGSGSLTPVNGALNVSGQLFGNADIERGSNDGWFGPDSAGAGGISGASTTDTTGYKINAAGAVVGLRVSNNSGQDLELSTLVFDYLSIWLTGSQKVQVIYDYGQLDDANGTLLSTLDAPGQSGGTKVMDYQDLSLNLQSVLTDYTLATGQFAQFKLQGTDAVDPEGLGVNGIVDNIAFTGTVIPEPATIGLVSMVSGGILFIRRRFSM